MKAARATRVLTREVVNRRLVMMAAIVRLLEFGGNAAEVYAPRAARFVIWRCAAGMGVVAVMVSERHKVERRS